MKKRNIVIFASGSGSNAEKIMEFCQSNSEIQVTAIVTNNPSAGVLQRAEKFGVLLTIPGVGKILAAIILYETGDIARFKSVKHYCSYARVVPGIAQSSNTIRRGKGSKQGNPYLKFAYTQAAALAVRYTGPIRRFREKHMARRRSKGRKMISISIVAHKLATAAYYMLTRQEPFCQELMFGSYQ